MVRCCKDGGDALVAGKDDPTSLLSDCRILRKDDLQVVKGNAAPRVPDCFQRTPKKVMLPEMGQILATAVDTQGLALIIIIIVVVVIKKSLVLDERALDSELIPVSWQSAGK